MDDIELVGKPGLAARLSLTDVETLRFHPATFRGNRDFTDAAQFACCIRLDPAISQVASCICTMGCDLEHHKPRRNATLRKARMIDAMTEGPGHRT